MLKAILHHWVGTGVFSCSSLTSAPVQTQESSHVTVAEMQVFLWRGAALLSPVSFLGFLEKMLLHMLVLEILLNQKSFGS